MPISASEGSALRRRHCHVPCHLAWIHLRSHPVRPPSHPITPHHIPCTPSQPRHNSVTPPLHPPKIPMTHPSDIQARSFPCRTCIAMHLTTSERQSTTNVTTSERFRVEFDFDLAYISKQLLERCYPSVS